jgi:glycosyltransferase involved in cell wall biosynthesis
MMLALGHAKRGRRVSVVSMLGPGEYGSTLETAGIKLYCLNMRRGVPNPAAILRLRKTILDFGPAVVHGHLFHANMLTRAVRMVMPLPALINTIHNVYESSEGGAWTHLREWAYRWTDPLCPLTTTIAACSRDRHGKLRTVPPTKLRLVHNGVQMPAPRDVADPLRLQIRQELGVSDEFLWLSAGRFVHQKDYPTLLHAFSQLSTSGSRGHLLVIAGDGVLRPEMEEHARRLGIAGKVRFLGVRHDMGALMSAADAFVLTSHWEGLSIVLLEAAARALPIVATNVGGNPEILPHGEFLPPEGDAWKISLAMRDMCRLSPQERRRVGETLRSNVERYFDIEKILDEWDAIYDEMITKG